MQAPCRYVTQAGQADGRSRYEPPSLVAERFVLVCNADFMTRTSAF